MFSNLKADKGQLGVYWGKDAFSLVESNKGLPEKFAHIRFDAKIAGDTGQKIPETLRMTALLQQVIREKKLTCKKANLTLSAKDVIYRSFVIPFMQPAEVKNVVDFEITKYIPIKLEDLSYTYHIIPFSEGDQKNLRILFVAIRKSILEKYIGILQQAGLEVEFAEPASVSIMRFLQKNGQVPKQQATALVEIEDDGGKIIISDKEVVQYVREFQSPVEGAGTPAENTKLFNDIRVSFNFYQRQNPQGKLDRIITLSTKDLTELCGGLSKDFKIPATSVTMGQILKTDVPIDLGLLCASGAAIRERAISTKNFDLPIKPARAAKASVIDPTSPLANLNLKLLIGSLAFSAGLIYLVFTVNNMLNGNNTTQYNNLKTKLGIFESSPQDKIVELRDGVSTKLSQYKAARTKSDITFYLQKIPQMLVPGAWLNNMNIDYEGGGQRDGKINISIEGYVYLQNSNDQIRAVNNMVQKMKTDKDFNKNFSDVILSTVRQEVIRNFPVTYFRIVFK